MNKISGTNLKPRISIFRSNKAILAQAIDDVSGVTIAAVKTKTEKSLKPVESAKKAGAELAKTLIGKKIVMAVFDRGSYRYHGRVSALADGLREGGVKI